MKALLGIFGFLLALTSVTAHADSPFWLVLVDKAAHKVHHAIYEGDTIKIHKTYHATLGRALGDKLVEKDLKTPEGIYFFTHKLFAPNLKKKFGRTALLMNYPNPMDKRQKKTGFDIMLHATDDPSRLKKDYDSEGCVVIDNSEIDEIAPTVVSGITPIIVYDELKPEHQRADGNPAARKAFETWLNAWRTKDLETYAGFYSEDFRYNGMNARQYRDYKASLNQKYAQITIDAQNVRYFYHPKYTVVLFTQVYESRYKNGKPAFRSNGTKVVYLEKVGERYRIPYENFSNIPQMSAEQLQRLTTNR